MKPQETTTHRLQDPNAIADSPRLGDACAATLDRTKSPSANEAGLGIALDLILGAVSKGRRIIACPSSPNIVS